MQTSVTIMFDCEGAREEQIGCWEAQPTEEALPSACTFSGSCSMHSSQTHDLLRTASPAFYSIEEQFSSDDGVLTDSTDLLQAHTDEITCPVSEYALEGWLQPAAPIATYTAYREMMRSHKLSEKPWLQQHSSLAGSDCMDESSRMIVVSWMVEVAEEFGLQQETLHAAAAAMLDRFLSTSHGVPRCALQLVAVGCIFLASKQLEVRHPSVGQLVAVAAHSFTASDLLRVERILLDALDFNITLPTPYSFLHLLTQATLAATNCSNNSSQQLPQGSAAAVAAAAAGPSPAMEAVVSLAMYLTELALLDKACTAFPGSTIATAALLLAHTTLSGHCQSWDLVLHAADMQVEQVAPAVAVLRRLHVAAAAPPSQHVAELLQPLAAKFGQQCWCRVAADVTPLDMQQQQEQQQQ